MGAVVDELCCLLETHANRDKVGKFSTVVFQLFIGCVKKKFIYIVLNIYMLDHFRFFINI